MTHYVHNLSPFAVQFGPDFGIRWYGLAYAAGLLIAWGLFIQLCRQGLAPFNAKQRSEFIFALMLGVVIGGRLGYMLLYDLPAFAANPLRFFQFQHGGMASHGGFVGVALSCVWFAHRQKISKRLMFDLACIMTPAGLLLGRLANFINGELWGRISNAPWAVIFPQSAPAGTPLSLIAPRHPSQLYEALLEGLFLLVYTQIRYRATRLKNPGQLTAEFIFIYALARIIGEQFRQPDAELIFGLSRGIFYSLFMFPLAAGLWWASRGPANIKK